jgi:hypothetical protein
MKPTNKCELACLRNEVFPVFWERSYRTHTQQDRNPDAPYNASPRVSKLCLLGPSQNGVFVCFFGDQGNHFRTATAPGSFLHA